MPARIDEGSMDETPSRKLHESALGFETEVGATSGMTHAKVLEQTLGHERAMQVASKNGPPPPRR